MSADKNPRWETGGEPKRRRIDKIAQTEAIAGPSNTSQSNDRQSVIDIACDDHPAWRVKVEPPVEDENDKLMEEGDDTDQLRDENISSLDRDEQSRKAVSRPRFSIFRPWINEYTFSQPTLN